MPYFVKGLAGLIVVGSQTALAMTPSLPESAHLKYQGTTSDADLQTCAVRIDTDLLARPVTVAIDLPDAAQGNVNRLDATLDYTPLLPGSAVIVPTTGGYSITKTQATGGLLEIVTVDMNGDDQQKLKSLAITRNFVDVLGVKITCNDLKAL